LALIQQTITNDCIIDRINEDLAFGIGELHTAKHLVFLPKKLATWFTGKNKFRRAGAKGVFLNFSLSKFFFQKYKIQAENLLLWEKLMGNTNFRSPTYFLWNLNDACQNIASCTFHAPREICRWMKQRKIQRRRGVDETRSCKFSTEFRRKAANFLQEIIGAENFNRFCL